MMQGQECHARGIEHITSEFETHLEKGLTQAEVQDRLKKHGPNELTEKPRPGFFQLLLSQFNNFLVIILIVAAVVSILWGR
jgi:Ca2+-transporting ATPase